MTTNDKLMGQLGALLQDEGGRLFCGWLLETAGILRVAPSLEPAVMAFAEGQRNVGLTLVAMLEAVDAEALSRCRSAWLRSLKEDELNGRSDRTGDSSNA